MEQYVLAALNASLKYLTKGSNHLISNLRQHKN